MAKARGFMGNTFGLGRNALRAVHGPSYIPMPEGRGFTMDLDKRKAFLPYYTPQHFLYFLPLPHGQGALRPIFAPWRRTVFIAVSPVSPCASESVPRCSTMCCSRRLGCTVSSSSARVS